MLGEDERERHNYKVEPEIRITRTCGSGGWRGRTGSDPQNSRGNVRPGLCLAKPENPIKKSIIYHRPPHKSMFSSSKPVVENTEENRQICRKYCTICQNYKHHSLEKYQPTELFCGCGTSSAPSMKEIGCFCPACELFSKNHLRGGYFCVRH